MGPDESATDWPPCTKACPAGIDIPGYLRLIDEGKPEEACALILEKVPFPGILGRVCMHPCEDACRRREVFNRPISICALKRYAADNAGDVFERALKMGELTGHKVAVIGAGPAGLTAAFYLRKKGHDVTVFETKSKAGGMMRHGIPSYRLPEDVLEQEINRVLSVGIQLETEKRLGKDCNSVWAYAFTPPACRAIPGKRCVSDLLHKIKLNMSDDPSDIEVIDSGNGACRATASALFAGRQHAYIAEILRQCHCVVHMYLIL